MRVQFLETAEPGLRWFKTYYAAQSQLDGERVFKAFAVKLEQLKQAPYSGKIFDDFPGVWEAPVPRSPFSILYTLKDETIFIIDIRDRRVLRSARTLSEFTKHLKSLYGLE